MRWALRPVFVPASERPSGRRRAGRRTWPWAVRRLCWRQLRAGRLRPTDHDLLRPADPPRPGYPRRAGGINHLLAVLASEVLARTLASLNVVLGKFLPHIGVVVLDAVSMVRVVLPLVEIVDVAAI